MLAALNLRRALAIALRRGWGRICAGDMRQLVKVFVEFEAELLVPLGVLATALDGFGAPGLAVEDDLAVWVLLAYVSFIREVPLRCGGPSRVSANRAGQGARDYTHRFQDDGDERADVAAVGHLRGAGGVRRRGQAASVYC